MGRRFLVALILPAVALAGCADVLNPGAKSGEPAPDFHLVDLEGDAHNLTMYRGHVVLLDFMASTCGPCRVQMPHLLEVNQTYPDVIILSVSVDPAEKNETLAEFRDDFAAPWPFAKGQFFGGIREAYGVVTLPKVVVIDPTGNITFASRPGAAVDEARLFSAVREARGSAA